MGFFVFGALFLFFLGGRSSSSESVWLVGVFLEMMHPSHLELSYKSDTYQVLPNLVCYHLIAKTAVSGSSCIDGVNN